MIGSDASDRILSERLVRLRQAHQVLAHELGAAQRRLHEREREVRELRAALRAYKRIRRVPSARGV